MNLDFFFDRVSRFSHFSRFDFWCFQAIRKRKNVFSFKLSLSFILCNKTSIEIRLPFTGETVGKIATKVLSGQQPSKPVIDVTPSIWEVVNWCLCPRPSKGYQILNLDVFLHFEEISHTLHVFSMKI